MGIHCRNTQVIPGQPRAAENSHVASLPTAGFRDLRRGRDASERSIAARTRHRSLATLRRYIRLAAAFDDNAVDGWGCDSGSLVIPGI